MTHDTDDTDTLRGPVPQPWGDVYSADEVAQAQRAGLHLLRALQVLVLTPAIQRYLAAHDPKALLQAVEALQRAGGILDTTVSGILWLLQNTKQE